MIEDWRQWFEPGTFAVWRTRSATNGSRSLRPRILIVCEGAKTEPNYFFAFKVTNDIYGPGLETIRVVNEAIHIYETNGPFDQVWCVFDRDSFPAADFDNAINKVESRAKDGFCAAYSNESFELWYVLHFEFLNAALPRHQYIERLTKLLGKEYRKGDPSIYALIQELGSEEQAIRNAEQLRELYETDEKHKPPSDRCPVTTVDYLVRELRKHQSK